MDMYSMKQVTDGCGKYVEKLAPEISFLSQDADELKWYARNMYVWAIDEFIDDLK